DQRRLNSRSRPAATRVRRRLPPCGTAARDKASHRRARARVDETRCHFAELEPRAGNRRGLADPCARSGKVLWGWARRLRGGTVATRQPTSPDRACRSVAAPSIELAREPGGFAAPNLR